MASRQPPLATPTPAANTDSAVPKPKPDYSAPADAPYTAEDVMVKTPAGFTLAGTLTLPKGASRSKPVPAIVTITGSGPEDRDEDIGLPGYQPFRQIADSLGRHGIAVLRMDDRGTGASGGTFKGATSADFAEDIRAGLAYLRTRPEIRADRLGVLGHSEGAIIAPMVAEKEPTLRAIVLLAGIAEPGPQRTRIPDEERRRAQHQAYARRARRPDRRDPGEDRRYGRRRPVDEILLYLRPRRHHAPREDAGPDPYRFARPAGRARAKSEDSRPRSKRAETRT